MTSNFLFFFLLDFFLHFHSGVYLLQYAENILLNMDALFDRDYDQNFPTRKAQYVSICFDDVFLVLSSNFFSFLAISFFFSLLLWEGIPTCISR